MKKFDGKAYSESLLKNLQTKVKGKNIKIKFASILVGEDPASKLYTKMKKNAAEKIGIEMKVYELAKDSDKQEIISLINKLNQDERFKGIMIQLPLPDSLKEFTSEIVDHISLEKDIDGMRENSKCLPATVRGIISILREAEKSGLMKETSKFAIVGSKGNIGKKLFSLLSDKFSVTGFELGDSLESLKNFDVIISATGKANLIKKRFVKDGVVVIDVGAPKPEFEEEVYEKASFYTPVPGGVGPVTICSLMQNVVEGA